jgi:hypothetical protein
MIKNQSSRVQKNCVVYEISVCIITSIQKIILCILCIYKKEFFKYTRKTVDKRRSLMKLLSASLRYQTHESMAFYNFIVEKHDLYFEFKCVLEFLEIIIWKSRVLTGRLNKK